MSHHQAVMEDIHEQNTEIKGIIGIRNFWTTDVVSCINESKKGGNYHKSIQSSTTPDLGYHMGKWPKHKRHKQSQEVSPFPAGDHKAAMNRRESMTNTRHK